MLSSSKLTLVALTEEEVAPSFFDPFTVGLDQSQQAPQFPSVETVVVGEHYAGTKP